MHVQIEHKITVKRKNVTEWQRRVGICLKTIQWRRLLWTVESAFDCCISFRTKVIISVTHFNHYQLYDYRTAAAGGCKADARWHITTAAHCIALVNKMQRHLTRTVTSKTAYPFELIRERLCGVEEFPFLVLVAVFNLKQLCFQLSLWHTQFYMVITRFNH